MVEKNIQKFSRQKGRTTYKCKNLQVTSSFLKKQHAERSEIEQRFQENSRKEIVSHRLDFQSFCPSSSQKKKTEKQS